MTLLRLLLKEERTFTEFYCCPDRRHTRRAFGGRIEKKFSSEKKTNSQS